MASSLLDGAKEPLSSQPSNGDTAPASTSTGRFTQFSNFPIEIRRKIWVAALPGPRVLHIVPNLLNLTGQEYTVSPASYGGVHPAILFANHESRTEALLFLTLKFGAYWNLEIDAAYVEAKDDSQNGVKQLAEVRRLGLLAEFRNLALDVKYFEWDWVARGFLPSIRLRRQFRGYEHPITTLNLLTNIKKCSLVYTNHTHREDVVKPHEAWYLGPLDEETTLSDRWEEKERQIKGEIEAFRKPWKDCLGVTREALRGGGEIEVEVVAIHGRTRAHLLILG